tara:strand:- start:3 stop:314 length:312 start_codon:yes stop_codon:yes gene_type:complete
MEKGYPMILVFYIDRETITNGEVIKIFSDQVNKVLAEKEANAIAFFLPTSNGESERIECVNPIQVEPAKMGEINKIIQDIQNNFDIGNGADDDIDNPENSIEL